LLEMFNLQRSEDVASEIAARELSSALSDSKSLWDRTDFHNFNTYTV